MDEKVTAYIQKQPSPQKAICEKLREIIIEALPEVIEEFKLGVPYFNNKYYIVALKDHVNIGFPIKNMPKAEIDKLQGSGKTVRVIEIRSLEEIDNVRIKNLLKLV